jgi:anaphase-promoting complex subunit 6
LGKSIDTDSLYRKSTALDPSFSVAWVGFGHTLAADGEHDQAISAYSTAAKYMRGSHLPSLYMAMQYLQQQHLGLSEEYMSIARQQCRNDPCLMNELGVLRFQTGKFNEAKDLFLSTLENLQISKGTDIWESVTINLGHCYRRLGMEHSQKRAEHYSNALVQFESVLKSNKDHFGAIAGMGYVLQLQGERDKAIEVYHRALSLQMDDVFCTEMIQELLESNISLSIDIDFQGVPYMDMDLESI